MITPNPTLIAVIASIILFLFGIKYAGQDIHSNKKFRDKILPIFVLSGGMGYFISKYFVPNIYFFLCSSYDKHTDLSKCLYPGESFDSLINSTFIGTIVLFIAALLSYFKIISKSE